MHRNRAAFAFAVGLALITLVPSASADPRFQYVLSSGLFALPANGKSVDWAIVNDSAVSRTVRVTVYKHGIGVPREVVAPGPLTLTLASTESSHNANSVGTVFQIGFNYEVVLETNSLKVLPVVHVWEDFGNTVIPGTAIPAGSWIRLR
jgi:hypothetical protein